MKAYTDRVGEMQQGVLKLLFRGFSDNETSVLYQGIMKLQENISEIENYVEDRHGHK